MIYIFRQWLLVRFVSRLSLQDDADETSVEKISLVHVQTLIDHYGEATGRKIKRADTRELVNSAVTHGYLFAGKTDEGINAVSIDLTKGTKFRSYTGLIEEELEQFNRAVTIAIGGGLGFIVWLLSHLIHWRH